MTGPVFSPDQVWSYVVQSALTFMVQLAQGRLHDVGTSLSQRCCIADATKKWSHDCQGHMWDHLSRLVRLGEIHDIRACVLARFAPGLFARIPTRTHPSAEPDVNVLTGETHKTWAFCSEHVRANNHVRPQARFRFKFNNRFVCTCYRHLGAPFSGQEVAHGPEPIGPERGRMRESKEVWLIKSYKVN